MYGLINKLTAQVGSRDELADIMSAGTQNMPNCKSYVIAKCASDENLLWITEVWTDKESHQASLQLPSVQEAIAKGRPLIAGMECVATTAPVE